MLAWLMRTDLAIRQIERLAWDWVKLDCEGGKCYGLLAVRPPSPTCTLACVAALLFSLGREGGLRLRMRSLDGRRCTN